MTAPAGITVIVPVFNKRAFLPRCLASVLDAADKAGGVRVLVIDDGSTDGSDAVAEALCRGRAEFTRESHRTIAAVRNAGAKRAATPLLSFVDCDIVLPPEYFTTLRDVFADPAIAATGCRVTYPHDASWIERAWDLMHVTPSDGFRAYLNSGNFAVRREAFAAVGGFDEALLTGEDAELGQRLNDAGHRVYESRRLAVLHVDNPRTIGAFFRKEVWHADGMFGTVRLGSIDRPTAMTVLHLLLAATALWLLATSRWSAGLLAAVAAALLAVPLLTVAYRSLASGRPAPVVAGTALYEVYYAARITALFKVAGRALKRAFAR